MEQPSAAVLAPPGFCERVALPAASTCIPLGFVCVQGAAVTPVPRQQDGLGSPGSAEELLPLCAAMGSWAWGTYPVLADC